MHLKSVDSARDARTDSQNVGAPLEKPCCAIPQVPGIRLYMVGHYIICCNRTEKGMILWPPPSALHEFKPITTPKSGNECNTGECDLKRLREVINLVPWIIDIDADAHIWLQNCSQTARISHVLYVLEWRFIPLRKVSKHRYSAAHINTLVDLTQNVFKMVCVHLISNINLRYVGHISGKLSGRNKNFHAHPDISWFVSGNKSSGEVPEKRLELGYMHR